MIFHSSDQEDAVYYRCFDCGNNLTHLHQIMSKNFRGRTGSATLFANVVNVIMGPLEESRLSTGLHTIRAVHCSACLVYLGWYYESAVESDQRYKEGHYILEEDLIECVNPSVFISSEEPLAVNYNYYTEDDTSVDDYSDESG